MDSNKSNNDKAEDEGNDIKESSEKIYINQPKNLEQAQQQRVIDPNESLARKRRFSDIKQGTTEVSQVKKTANLDIDQKKSKVSTGEFSSKPVTSSVPMPGNVSQQHPPSQPMQQQQAHGAVPSSEQINQTLKNLMVSMPVNIRGLNLSNPFPRVLNPYMNMYNLQQMQQAQAQAAQSQAQKVQNQVHQSALAAAQLGNPGAVPGRTDVNGHVAGANNTVGKERKVNEALRYLEHVKRRFRTQPEIYHEFLNTMKKFKSNAIDTPGVLKAVISLFAPYVELISGFNKFLPTGFTVKQETYRYITVYVPDGTKIKLFLDGLDFTEFNKKMESVNKKLSAEVLYYDAKKPIKESDEANARHAAISGMSAQAQPNRTQQPQRIKQTSQPPGPTMLNAQQVLQNSLSTIPSLGAQQNPMNLSFPMLQNFPRLNTAGGMVQRVQGVQGRGAQQIPVARTRPNLPASFDTTVGPIKPSEVQTAIGVKEQQQQQQGKTEFSEAIQYVSKIKQRFAHDSQAYRSFLDILHTYQKDQGTIKRVLQKVARLFEGHSDLLKEFCFFLPDESREKAKKIVKDILRRKNAEYDITRIEKFEDKYGERILWQQLKNKFRDSNLFLQFLSVLEMMMKTLITKKEFLLMTTNLLKKASLPVDAAKPHQPTRALDESSQKLLERLNAFLCTHNIVDSPVLSAFYSLPMMDMDFEDSFRPTPSYRQLPDAYLRFSDPSVEDRGDEKVRYKLNACSGRTRLCNEVLNDRYISVSTGSEDSSFKQYRKNIYEENLFKCEDERHSFDMIYEWNKKTLIHLKKLYKQVSALDLSTLSLLAESDQATSAKNSSIESKVSEADGKRTNSSSVDDVKKQSRINFVLGKGSLRILHVKAISRIYGSYAEEIMELVRTRPEKTLPIVIKRLETQDVLLHHKKKELEIEWKKVHEVNFPKSLDHRSFYFKQTDKKDLSSKSLLSQMKAIYKRNPEALKGHKSEFVKFFVTPPETTDTSSEKGSLVNEEIKKVKRPSLLQEKPEMYTRKGEVHVEIKFDIGEEATQIHKDCFELMMFSLKRSEYSSKSSLTSYAQKKRGFKVLLFICKVLAPFFGIKQEDIDAACVNTSIDNDATQRQSQRQKDTKGKDNNYNHCFLRETAIKVLQSVKEKNETKYGSSILEIESVEAFDVTKLLSQVSDKRQSKVKESATTKADNGRVLYGSSSFFLFFRLYNILYERLKRARYAAEEATMKEKEREGHKMEIDGSNEDTSVTMLQKNKVLSADERYRFVFNEIFTLLSGELNSLDFEDICRKHLLSSSYFLFTVEKLLSLIEKHLENSLLLEDKIKSQNRKIRDFEQLQTADKLVVCHRQSYQQLMNQVDGLGYKLVFHTGFHSSDKSIKPRIECSLSKSFQQTDSEAMVDESGRYLETMLLPVELDVESCTIDKATEILDKEESYEQNRSDKQKSAKAVVLYSIFENKPVLLKEEEFLFVKEIRSVHEKILNQKKQLQSNQDTQIKERPKAKQEWWYFGNYEEAKAAKAKGEHQQDDTSSEDVLEGEEEGNKDADKDKETASTSEESTESGEVEE